MTQEALKLALDFIENGNLGEWRGITERRKEIITAIKEALAQTQEPVATLFGSLPVYDTTPPQRTEQNFCSRCGKRTKDIHTCTPPQEENT